MRIAAIDIGTNTILMLIADVDSSGHLRVVRDEHEIARLGKGVDHHKHILPDTFERALRYLSNFKRIADSVQGDRVIACGTSALRDAVNREEFVEFIRKQLGFTIEVLSGHDEAEWTFRGAISEFAAADSPETFGVLDIGGGSTELTFGTAAGVSAKQSLDVGCVRLTERILKTSPPTDDAIQTTRQEIRRHLLSQQTEHVGRFIGVAGTVTTLGAIDLQMPKYDRERVSGHILPIEKIKTIYADLRTKSLDQLRAVPQILPLRADILLAGIIILIEVMEHLKLTEITVSDRGLRYGLVMREMERMKR